MKKKYLIFIDFDGTLSKPGECSVSKKILKYMKKLGKKGHIFVLSTGRSLKSALRIEGVENFQYLSLLAGSLAYDNQTKQVLKSPEPFPEKEVLRFIKMISLNDMKWSYKTQEGDKTFYKDVEFFAKRPDVVKIEEQEFFDDLKNGNVVQILTLGVLSEKIKKSFSCFDYFQMPQNYADVTLKGSSKANGVKFFKDMFEGYETVSIGDSLNDVPMFQTTDISIAMGNASDDIKKMTTYVTKSLDEDGVLFALKKILKI